MQGELLCPDCYHNETVACEHCGERIWLDDNSGTDNMLDYSAQAVPDSEYNDLDPVEQERLRNIIRTYRGEIFLLELSDVELDKALRFVTMSEGKPVPPFCGLLLNTGLGSGFCLYEVDRL